MGSDVILWSTEQQTEGVVWRGEQDSASLAGLHKTSFLQGERLPWGVGHHPAPFSSR